MRSYFKGYISGQNYYYYYYYYLQPSSAITPFPPALRDAEMASSDLMTPKLTVNDIFGFSDAELVQYMKQNRRDGGGFDLDFDGWDNLAKEQRDQLARRLK